MLKRDILFENVTNGWKLGSATRKLVFKDKQLLLYPVLSMLITVVLMAAIFLPTILISRSVYSPLFILGVIIFYIIVSFVSTYLLMALLIAFRSYTKGKKISIGEAMHLTAPYTVQIFEWALFYTVLIMILRAIESRFGGIGRLIIGSIGSLAISAATLFAVPVILDKKVGPITAVKESAAMLIHNFGNTFGGIVYSDLYGLNVSLPGILLIVVAVLSATASIGLLIILGVTGFALLALGSIISYTTSNAFRLILYDYTNGRGLPDGFTKEMMQSAIKQKRGAPKTPMPESFA